MGQNTEKKSESMAEHLGIDDRRKEDRRKIGSAWLGIERRKNQRRRNPYVYKNKGQEK